MALRGLQNAHKSLTYKGIGECRAITLTAGADTVAGTSGNDTIRALTVDGTGAAATTLSAFDAIDGGAGTDTLNIYSDGTDNTSLPTSATVSNVEIINIYNDTAAFDTDGAGNIDASKFAGATNINQVGLASATMTKLAATTTATFTDIAAGTLAVEPADAAATATVAFVDVDDQTSLDVDATATGTLNSVTVSGTVVDGNADDDIDSIALGITVGKDIQTLTVNSAIAATLTVTDGAGTKTVTTVNAGSSTGDLTYVAAATVANVTTGSGDDVATLATAYTATLKAATLTTGAGDDDLSVDVDNSGSDVAGVTVTVDAGAGNDVIDVNTTNGANNDVALDITGGAGDDKVTLTIGIDAVATTDVIDGGADTDTIVIAGKTLDAEDYILLRDVITNFEAIEFTGATGAVVDASRMAAYKDFTFAGNATDAITKVAAGTTLTTAADLTATHAGFDAGADATAIEGDETYAGTLSITSTGAGTVTAFAQTVALNVEAQEAAAADADVVLEGDVTTATVTLTNNVDDATTPTTDVLATVSITTDATVGAEVLTALTSVTLSGNGQATVVNVEGAALATVNAAALDSVDFNGDAITGLTYTTTNESVAETVTLGDGLDVIQIGDATAIGSSYLNQDTITGLNLVDDGTGAVDAALSDSIQVFDGAAGAVAGFAKTTVAGATLDLALVNAAASADGDALVFAFGGDTYIFVDQGVVPDDLVTDTDIVIKLTGTVDLDLLVDALG